MLLNTSFGLVYSEDEGAHWSWTCVESLGFDVDDDPRLFTAIRDDDSLHAASAFGLYGYAVAGCAWTRPDELNSDYHSALVRDPSTDTLWTVTSNASGQNFVYQSSDGTSWTPWGSPLPDLLYEGLAIGTFGSDRIFISAIERGSEEMPRRAVGVSWIDEQWVVSPIADAESPIFAEVLTERLPLDAPIVVALTDRSIGAVQSTMVSRDGGMSWSSVNELAEKRIVSAVWSDDATSLWLGGRAGAGIWQSTDGAVSFELVNADAEASCLYQADNRLFVCADQFSDGFMLGQSSDGGRSIDALADFDDIDAEFACSRDTLVGETCRTPALDVQNDLNLTLRPPPSVDEGCTCSGQPSTTNTFSVFFLMFLLTWLTHRRAVSE